MSLEIFLITMIIILMMSVKMATPGLFKITIFWNKGYDVIIPVHGVPTKFYHVIQIILKMWSFDQSLVTLAFLNFLMIVLVQVRYFRTDTRYKIEILHQCGKRVKTKSQKVLGPNSYVCRSHRGKTGRGGLFGPSHLE